MQEKFATGLSMSKELKQRIDEERGEVSRSRYICRLLEKLYSSNYSNKTKPGYKTKKNRRDSPDMKFPALLSSESRIPKKFR